METALRALAGAVGVAGCGMLAVEAPGGVEIAGACRSQTDPLAGYTFAAAARGLIAQDADAIVLGRLGDPVTMAAAVEAALAGGLVVGAVRSADAAEGLACLAEMAPEPWALASVLRAVVACRTVRRLCRACRKAVHSPEQPPPEIGMAREQLGTKLYRAVGCDRCGQTGYDGTIPLAAVVIPDRPVVALIRDRAGRDAFAAACRDAGAPSFTQLAAERLRAGETSLEEIARAL
jgi:type II secretory ATPase GspE/PulE/Tfp pilus assembly ATPase PilB-like protein